MTDFETWIHDFGDRIYRYWVYKRMYTPYEQAQQFTDESEFKDVECAYGVIKEAIELPDGDVLLGFGDPSGTVEYIEYFKLSEIQLAYSATDAEGVYD